MAVHTQDNAKLVTLANLALYNHTLIENLGLTQDNGAYAYGGTREDNPEATTVGKMLDELYDLVKAGSMTLGNGKNTTTQNADIVFEPVEGTNDYYINAKIGDDTFNIKLNADDFVKDSFLDSVAIVKGSKNEDETFTPSETGDAYFKFVWKTTNGNGADNQNGQKSETTYIKTSDILGDLTAGNGIAINDGATISVKVAENTDDNSVKLTSGNDGVKVEVTSNKIASGTTEDGETTWSLESDNKSVIADATTTVAAINDLQGQIDDLEAKSIEGKNAINVAVKEDDATTQVIELTLADSYLSQSEDGLSVETGEVEFDPSTASTVSEKFSGEDNELATTQEVAKVANELQGEIDSLNAASLVDGTAINDNTASGHTLTKLTVEDGKENAGATYYELKLATATDDEIAGLFAPCGSTDEPGETMS